MPAEKQTTRPARITSYSDALRTHVVTGIGYSSSCSCGWRSPLRNTFRAAMQSGREHARDHTAGTAGHPDGLDAPTPAA